MEYELKTKCLQIRTTPKIKKWLKENNISQTEVFNRAINELMKQEKN